MSGAVAAAVAIAAMVAACGGKRDDDGAPPEPVARAPVMAAAEIRRAEQACAAYVAQVCACADTVEAARQPCALARAMPDAIATSVAVMTSPEPDRRAALHAADFVRKTVAECIAQTAKLPALGC